MLSKILLAFCVAASLAASARAAENVNFDRVAERYVKLVLAVGEHDAAYVDAYYGPGEWAEAATAAGKRPLAELGAEADELLGLLGEVRAPDDEMGRLRYRYLARQLEAVRAYIDILGGRKMTFDEESRALYDAVAPTHDEAYFSATIRALEALLPGEGPLGARVEHFRADFVIPADRLDKVFQAAIAEARRRTREHLDLPEEERFVVEYVSNKPWSGYNWYKGNSYSLIQVNTDLPIHISRAIDLACHEGYPGHHVYNALLEQHLVRERGWIEYAVYPLFSPQSLIAEGTANFGIEVAFPGEERVDFEREVLFPLAGLDASRAAAYYQVEGLLDQLDYAGNEAARGYIDGRMTREAAMRWLQDYALMSPERAKQRLEFIDTYRSYVINYNLGLDLVRHYVEARGGTTSAPERRWAVFGELLSSPRLPSGLQ